MQAPDQVLTVAQMQAAEQALINAGTSVDELMLRAGRGAADYVWRLAAGRAVTVLCGPGNNGGDGYVIAETLRARRLDVAVVAPIEPKTDAARNARHACTAPVKNSGKSAHSAVLVDCLFGSGLARPLSGEHALLLRDLAGRHPVRIAVDLPSGIESDSGEMLNEGLPRYDLTIALGAWKHAHWRLPARAKMGAKRLVGIGVARQDGAARLLGKPQIAPPAAESHKYRRGLCAVIGGAMPGAGLLAAQAAMRAGAGYVKLFAPHSHPAAPAGLVIDDRDLGEALADDRIDAICIGPGLGRDEEAAARLRATLACGRPVLLDADALVLLTPDMLPEDMPLLATPHDGELDRLCTSFAVVASGRHAKAQALATASGMTIIAKGPDTVIASPDGELVLAPPAPSWLSIAGTGDVLAGIAASRMTNRRAPFEAACDAVWLHGEAARLSGAAFTPDDLAQAVAGALASAL